MYFLENSLRHFSTFQLFRLWPSHLFLNCTLETTSLVQLFYPCVLARLSSFCLPGPSCWSVLQLISSHSPGYYLYPSSWFYIFFSFPSFRLHRAISTEIDTQHLQLASVSSLPVLASSLWKITLVLLHMSFKVIGWISIHSGVIWEEGPSIKKMPPPHWPVENPVVHYLLIYDWCGMAQLIVGSATPERVVLGGTRK